MSQMTGTPPCCSTIADQSPPGRTALGSNAPFQSLDYNIGTLLVGPHTLRIAADTYKTRWGEPAREPKINGRRGRGASCVLRIDPTGSLKRM